jgi:NTP pyrophosphatase (non-canonical NTP hydrolase)
MEDKLDIIFQKALRFRNERDWKQFHDPKNLAEALSIESGELLEKFLWMSTEKSFDVDNQKLEEIKEEVADIMIYLTYLCDTLNIDLSQAVEKKLDVNNTKYPIGKSKGTSKKYKEL